MAQLSVARNPSNGSFSGNTLPEWKRAMCHSCATGNLGFLPRKEELMEYALLLLSGFPLPRE